MNMKILDIKKELAGNSYPGRGIVIGKSADGVHAVIAYFIMGRSVNSRNRVFAEQGDGIRTQAFDPAKLSDPSLVIYAPVRVLANKTIVTNGDQTDTIFMYLKEGKSFKNFAYLLVRRHILDAVKRSARRKNVPLNESVSLFDPTLGDRAEEGSPEDMILESEAQREFRRRLMKELSDFEFRVVIMYLEGMSYAEICEATGKGVKSIDNALSRAKRKLQTVYQGDAR